MKTFNKPYFEVVDLDVQNSLNTTCVLECSCDIETCTCNQVCGCDKDCLIYIEEST